MPGKSTDPRRRFVIAAVYIVAIVGAVGAMWLGTGRPVLSIVIGLVAGAVVGLPITAAIRFREESEMKRLERIIRTDVTDPPRK